MNYRLLKMNFYTPVHFGGGNLATTDYVIHADTVFSAICCEIAKDNPEKIETVKNLFIEKKLLISDAMPYIQDRYYIPKPFITIETDKGNSKLKKFSKKLKYIPIDELENYLQGKMEIERELLFFENNFARKDLVEKVGVKGNEKPEPYSVNVVYYTESSGLYLVVGYENDEDYWLLEKILECISFSGIGGKVSSGYGKFNLLSGKESEEKLFKLYLEKEVDRYMSLSVSLPGEGRLEDVVSNSRYGLLKRSGFVASNDYSESYRRKNDIYLFEAGSVFTNKFDGDIFDVSCAGKHPVYRYALPLFMGVD